MFLSDGTIHSIKTNPESTHLHIFINDTELNVSTLPITVKQRDLIRFEPEVNAAFEEGQRLFVTISFEKEDTNVEHVILGKRRFSI